MANILCKEGKEAAQQYKLIFKIIYYEWSKDPDMKQPAAFLENWMNGIQSSMTYPARILEKDKIINNHLESIHMSAFLGEWYGDFKDPATSLLAKTKKWIGLSEYLGGITARIKKNEDDVIGKTHKMHWEDSIDYMGILDEKDAEKKDGQKVKNKIATAGGSPNIYFALGNFTLTSEIELHVQGSGKQFEVSVLKWKVSLKDRYDFKVDSPRQLWSYGNNLTFAQAHCYEYFGFAKPFDVKSSWTHVPAKKKYRLSVK